MIIVRCSLTLPLTSGTCADDNLKTVSSVTMSRSTWFTTLCEHTLFADQRSSATCQRYQRGNPAELFRADDVDLDRKIRR